ncbi:hypothetical protein PZA11_003693 [Diplocarpon coronariae]
MGLAEARSRSRRSIKLPRPPSPHLLVHVDLPADTHSYLARRHTTRPLPCPRNRLARLHHSPTLTCCKPPELTWLCTPPPPSSPSRLFATPPHWNSLVPSTPSSPERSLLYRPPQETPRILHLPNTDPPAHRPTPPPTHPLTTASQNALPDQHHPHHLPHPPPPLAPPHAPRLRRPGPQALSGQHALHQGQVPLHLHHARPRQRQRLRAARPPAAQPRQLPQRELEPGLCRPGVGPSRHPAAIGGERGIDRDETGRVAVGWCNVIISIGPDIKAESRSHARAGSPRRTRRLGLMSRRRNAARLACHPDQARAA